MAKLMTSVTQRRSWCVYEAESMKMNRWLLLLPKTEKIIY